MAGSVVHLKKANYEVRIDRQSKWGNPFAIGADHPSYCGHFGPMTREDVIDHYRDWLRGTLVAVPDFLEPLRGKILGCWCKPEACHGDVILEMLDATDPGNQVFAP